MPEPGLVTWPLPPGPGHVTLYPGPYGGRDNSLQILQKFVKLKGHYFSFLVDKINLSYVSLFFRKNSVRENLCSVVKFANCCDRTLPRPEVLTSLGQSVVECQQRGVEEVHVVLCERRVSASNFSQCETAYRNNFVIQVII